MKKTIKTTLLALSLILTTGCEKTEVVEEKPVYTNQLKTMTITGTNNSGTGDYIVKNVNDWLSKHNYIIYDIQYDYSYYGSYGYVCCNIIYYVNTD